MGESERVMAVLQRGLAAEDPLPLSVASAGLQAFGLRSTDPEGHLAALVFDSCIDQPERPGVRSGGGRQLTFEAGERLVEVEIGNSGLRADAVVGQVVPPAPGRIVVRHSRGCIEAAADHLGRFAAYGVPTGPMSLRVELEGEPVLVTDWVVA